MPYFTDSPPVILPRVFAINTPPFQWCELRQVRDLVPALSAYAGSSYDPTPEQLVNDFAALAPYNHQTTNGKRPKILRYVVSPPHEVVFYGGTEVPSAHHPYFKHLPFVLGARAPYPESLFVPMQWALDTLSAILSGATCATEREVTNQDKTHSIHYFAVCKDILIDLGERRMTT